MYQVVIETIQHGEVIAIRTRRFDTPEEASELIAELEQYIEGLGEYKDEHNKHIRMPGVHADILIPRWFVTTGIISVQEIEEEVTPATEEGQSEREEAA